VSVLDILKWPDVRLSRVCEPVGGIDDAVRRLADDMLETMYAAPGRGLAAPQVGIMKRLFVMDVAWKDAEPDPLVFVDPDITWRSADVVTAAEGCLSIPGVTAEIDRADEVEIAWRDLDGTAHARRFDGFAAICIQHEYDHLDGLVTFDRVSPERRAALEAAYSGAMA
jgi:peptide deformylase